MRSHFAIITAACASFAVGSPLINRQTADRPPCGQLSDIQAAFLRDNPDDIATAPAELVLKCLKSIPLDIEQSVALLDSLRPYLEFHSTFPWVKDPPQDYADNVRSPYDFWTNFNNFYMDVVNGLYINEYDFSYFLWKTFNDVKDFNFQAQLDTLVLFDFFRPFALVHISEDGQSLPKFYERNDIVVPVDYTPSEVVKINGQDPITYVTFIAEDAPYADKDTAWNDVFYTPAKESISTRGGTRGSFRDPFSYPGVDTALTFANGTVVQRDNFAYIPTNLTGINDGSDLRKKLLSPSVRTAAELASTWGIVPQTPGDDTNTTVAAPGYPEPVVRHPFNMNGGYFIDGEGFDDVAVLSIPSFAGYPYDSPDHQRVTSEFLRAAVEAKKQKLIVDLTGGNLGSVLLGYDVFKQLFPDLDPKDPLRARVHEAFDLIGNEASAYLGQPPPSTVDQLLGLNDTARFIASNTTNVVNTVDVNGQKFESFADLLNGGTAGGDNYTSVHGFDLSLAGGFVYALGEVAVSGYGTRSNLPPRPFAPENIVVITDGRCTAACTITYKLLREQAGVKVITIGGRPNTNQIQALGSSRGHGAYDFGDMLWQATAPFALQTLHSASDYASTALGKFNDLPYNRIGYGLVNYLNSYRSDDLTTPWQFKLEWADCRFFWTGPMLANMTNLWKAVAETAFLGKSHCIAGGL
ncbi:unnamed protein product [Zymoseptoria tritici ST99CH_1E4]|uniref:CPAF-like PDZ domain-containing protein n=1 Tax=Zymoseptoria tritici ST99CH_1E4 TaxID=1276532 RepID=A0A2H1GCV2_ZYMTR|nr:unnamed protein product [Zymoseptoria tritici ST99CH_1E4]